MGAPRGTLQERFWRFADTSGDCWIWTGAKHRDGYGLIASNDDGHKKLLLAHRVSYEMSKGPVGDLFVLHTCDNRQCVNPAHLRVGTHQTNMADMRSKGRSHGQARKRLETQIEQLKTALSFYACTCEPGQCETGCIDDVVCGATARAALDLFDDAPQALDRAETLRRLTAPPSGGGA